MTGFGQRKWGEANHVGPPARASPEKQASCSSSGDCSQSPRGEAILTQCSGDEIQLQAVANSPTVPRPSPRAVTSIAARSSTLSFRGCAEDLLGMTIAGPDLWISGMWQAARSACDVRLSSTQA